MESGGKVIVIDWFFVLGFVIGFILSYYIVSYLFWK